MNRVLDRLKRQLESPGGPGSANRALVIEGGGMKAAYANGVLSAFEEADFAPWDVVLGTSAGGALAAWYSAGQAAFAEATWDYARDRRILSYRRALMGQGPLLDHEALLDIVYKDEHPLDVGKLEQAPWPVIVTVVETGSGALRYVDVRRPDAVEWLKATGRLPFGSGPPVTINGVDYLDGGVYDPIPIRHAVEDLGARHVTLVLNRPPERRRPDNRLLVEVAGRRYPALREGMLRHQEIKAEAYAFASSPPAGVRVDIVRPSRDPGVHRLSRDLAAIRRAIGQGRADGAAYVAGVDHQAAR